MLKSPVLAALLASSLLAACQGSGGGGSDTGSSGTGTGTGSGGSDQTTAPAPPGSGGSTAAAWTRGYVTSFDMTKVRQLRNSSAFQENGYSYRLTIPGHPVYDQGALVSGANPLLAARVDYAHSTGLTGAGQLVALVDDGIRKTHDQFDGKTITLAGTSTDSSHGTTTASIAVGNGGPGGSIGVAPGADLFMGQLDFSTSLDWRLPASYFDQAASMGAIVSSNSWGTPDLTLANTNMASYFKQNGPDRYLASARNFAKNGVIVFAMSNDYNATSASATSGLAVAFPDLAPSFISVINVIPTFDDTRITSGTRVSAACLETASYCIDANGQFYGAQNTGDSDYALGSGTSFATPQVAGAIALLAEAFPDLTAQQLRDRLLATADNSWFTPTDTVDFGDGVSHGYNDEFGHGFLDLKDALLPIGTTTIASAGGGAKIIAGAPAISGGALSGDAVAKSLASHDLIAVDAMAGVFKTSANILTAAPDTLPSRSAAMREAYAEPRLNGARRAQHAALFGDADYRVTTPFDGETDAIRAAGISRRSLLDKGDLQLGLLEDGEGLDIATSFDLAPGRLRLRATYLDSKGSLMGMTAPGFEAQTHGQVAGVGLGFATRLGDGFGLRVSGEIGGASGSLGGFAGEVHHLRYDRMSVSLDAADVFESGDVMTVFAARPAAMNSGSLDMSLPVALSNGAPVFAKAEIGLAPQARQVDLGLQYAAAAPIGGEWRAGIVQSLNAGQIRGARDLGAVIGYSIKF